MANYSYLADGTKFSATDADGNGLYYLGSLVYERSSSGQSLELESLGFDGGRFIKTTSGLEPRYFITDHLGSVRVVVNDQGEVLEQNDYYPFGLRWENAESPITDNRYRYNGKEEQSFVSVPYIDYGARMYDPKYGIRWTGVDPLAEKYHSCSPYAFCGYNPIGYIDPDGKKRRVVKNVRKKTITVEATYYFPITLTESVYQGIDVFNEDMNRRSYTYTDEEGDIYRVKFSLHAVRTPDDELKMRAESDEAGNYVKAVPPFGVNEEGQEILGKGGGYTVLILENMVKDKFVMAHEIGHTLGAAMKINGEDNHAPEGLMVESVDHPNKGFWLDQKSINEIVQVGKDDMIVEGTKKPAFWEWLTKLIGVKK